ncbi:MAG: four helix bundle protein [Opitutales bacterium]|jgi:four helix bundle protein
MSPDIQTRSFDFAVRVVRMCAELDKSAGVSRTLSNQVLRSGTSIGANIEEAQAGQSKADFISKMSIACKEARETLYWIRLFAATETLSAEKLAALQSEANEIVAILTTIVKRSRDNN